MRRAAFYYIFRSEQYEALQEISQSLNIAKHVRIENEIRYTQACKTDIPAIFFFEFSPQKSSESMAYQMEKHDKKLFSILQMLRANPKLSETKIVILAERLSEAQVQAIQANKQVMIMLEPYDLNKIKAFYQGKTEPKEKESDFQIIKSKPLEKESVIVKNKNQAPSPSQQDTSAQSDEPELEKTEKDQSWDKEIQKAHEHFSQNQFDEAKKCYERCLLIKPQSIIALAGLANTLHRLNAPEMAIDVLDNVGNLSIDHMDQLLGLDKIGASLHDFKSLRRILKDLEKTDDDDLKGAARDILRLIRSDNIGEAVQKRIPSILNSAGIILARTDRTEEAIERYEAALTMSDDPIDKAKIHFNMGLAYFRSMEMDSAVTSFIQSVQPTFKKAEKFLQKIKQEHLNDIDQMQRLQELTEATGDKKIKKVI